MVETADRALRRISEGVVNDSDTAWLRGLAEELGITWAELMEILGSANAQQILEGIAEGQGIPSDSGESQQSQQVVSQQAQPAPTFEELFQEQMEEKAGPDPRATYRNVFKDVFGGQVTTPYEEFIQNQFEDLEEAYWTFARRKAEKGAAIPTFEDFLAGEKERLKNAYQYTESGSLENLQNFIEHAESQGLNLRGTRFTQFIQENFDQLFNRFQRTSQEQGPGEMSPNFTEFLMDSSDQLRQEFEFTRGGATESLEGFYDQAKLRGFDLQSDPFANFQLSNFDSLFSEFTRLSGKGKRLTGQKAPGTYSEFLLQRGPRTQQEFGLTTPRERGQYDVGELSRPNQVR